MTSPDHIVPSKALVPQTAYTLQNYDGAANGAANNMWLTSVLESFRMNLLNNLLSGFQNVGAVVTEGIHAIGMALTGQPGGLQALEDWTLKLPFIGDLAEQFTGEDGDLNDIGSWVALAIHGRTTSLASRVAKIEGKIAEGADQFDDFNRGDSDDLGANWVQGGQGEPLGIHDQAAQQRRSLLPATGRRWARTLTPASGNSFTMSAVIHPGGVSPFTAMRIIARANAAMTEGLSVNLFAGKCYLSRFTRTPGTGQNNQDVWTDNDLTNNLAKSYSNSATVQFSGDENDHLWVEIDGATVLEVLPGTKDVGPVDAAHRYGGFSTAIVVGIPASYSGAPASFALRSTAELQAVPVATVTALAAQQTATEVKSQVAQIIAQEQTDTSQGFNGHETFDRPDAEVLDNGWDQLQVGNGALGIIGNAAAYYVRAGSGGGGNANAFAVGPGSFASDTQSGIFVIGTIGNGSSQTRGWIRCDGNKASPSGVFWESGEGYIRLCACVAGTITQLDRQNVRVANGDSIEIRAGDSGAVVVKRNGMALLSGTDAGQVPKGAGFRRYAISVVVFDAYYNQYRPPSINSIDVSDFGVPAVRGTAWRAARLGTAATSNISPNNQRLPAGTFGTVYASASVTLDSAGSVIVPTEGTYMIKFRLYLTNSNNGYAWRPILWRYDTVAGAWVVDQYGTDVLSPNSNENQYSLGDTFLVYCKAGDRIAIGLRQAGTVAIVGSAGGIDTFWTGTLVSS